MPKTQVNPAPDGQSTAAPEANDRKGRLPSGKAKKRAGYSPEKGCHGPWLPDSP